MVLPPGHAAGFGELQLVEHKDHPAAAPQQQAELRVGGPAARVVGAAACRGAAPLVGEQRAVPHAALAQGAQHAAVVEHGEAAAEVGEAHPQRPAVPAAAAPRAHVARRAQR